MGMGWALRSTWLVLFIGAAGSVGLSVTDASAVAGKDVIVTAGAQLAGATIEFELNDGTTVDRQVDQQGQVELPPNVNKDTVRNCYRKEQTASGESKERIQCGFWLPAGVAAGGTTANARPLGEMLSGTIVRLNGFAGGSSPNDFRDVHGKNIISGFSFSDINANAGYTFGAGMQVVFPYGWYMAVNYQNFFNNFPGQTIKENPGGLRDIAGGSVQTNAAVFNFGYEWDCWKNFRIGLGAGPIIGTTKVSTAGSERSSQASGWNAEGTLRYYVNQRVSIYGAYQYYSFNTKLEQLDVSGAGRRDFSATLSGNIGKIGVSWDF